MKAMVMIQCHDGSLLLRDRQMAAEDAADIVYNSDKRRGYVSVRLGLTDILPLRTVDVVFCAGWDIMDAVSAIVRKDDE